MKRKYIGAVLIVLGLAGVIHGQCSQGGFMKKLCQAQTGNFGQMASEAPLTTTFSDAIHGTTMPPSFNPPLFKDLKGLDRADDGAFVLKPGFYQITVESYAIDGGASPDAGYYPAPIKGSKAKAVTELLKSAELHPDVGEGDIQAVLNGVLRGDVASLPQRQQQVAAELLSQDSLQQLRGSQAGSVGKSVWGLVQRHIPGNSQVGQTVASAEGKVGYEDQKYGVSDTVNTFGGMSTGQVPVSPVITRGTWAQMPGGFYVRYLVDNAARTKIQVAVPDAVASGQTFDPTQYLAVSGGSPCIRLGMSVRVSK